MRTRMQSPGCVRVCVGVVSTRAIAEPASLSTSLCVPSLYTALLYPNRKDLERGESKLARSFTISEAACTSSGRGCLARARDSISLNNVAWPLLV